MSTTPCCVCGVLCTSVCPICSDLGIAYRHFCSSACQRSVWRVHKQRHEYPPATTPHVSSARELSAMSATTMLPSNLPCVARVCVEPLRFTTCKEQEKFRKWSGRLLPNGDVVAAVNFRFANGMGVTTTRVIHAQSHTVTYAVTWESYDEAHKVLLRNKDNAHEGLAAAETDKLLAMLACIATEDLVDYLLHASPLM